MNDLCKQFSYSYFVTAYIRYKKLYTKMAIESIGPGYSRMWTYDLEFWK